MRQLKWAGLAFFMGSLVMLSPDYSPAQFGKKSRGDGDSGGKGGFGKGGFGGGDTGGKGGFGGGKGGFGGGQPGGFGGNQGNSGGQPGGFGGGQPGGFGGQPRGFGGQPGGFGGGQPGGFGGGQPAFGGGQPGGFGGGQPGGTGGGGRPGFDPNAMWDRISQGQASINLNDPQNERLRGMMERMNVPVPPDGVVTRQMFVDGMQQRMAAGGPGGPGGGMVVIGGGPGGPGGPMGGGGFGGPRGSDRDQGLERLLQQDADKDGKVSRAEADNKLQPNFERIDVNADGFITLEEYRGYYANQQGGRDRGPGGPGGPPMGDFGGDRGYGRDDLRVTEEPKPVAMRYGHLPKDLPGWFDRDDGNKDGQVALHEWRLAGKKLEEFYSYDLNSDGLVTADELLRFNFKQTEDAKIAAYNDPDNPDNPKPSFAMRRGQNGGGFALPGSTPTSTNGYDRPQGKGDRQGKGGDRKNNEERAPDGGNGGPNPFRKKN